MSLETALDLIESVRDYKILFVGDPITDEYHYVTPMGKSPKEYLIPVKYEDKEVFAGGTVAASKHLLSFCNRVVVRAPGNPVRKVRYVQRPEMKKLFEVNYDLGCKDNGFLEDGYDVVVVTDFGHERLTGEMIEKLCRMPYLAVNTQTNSSNIGFNLITKYRRADYMVIDEPEARLAAGDRRSPIQGVIEKLATGRCKKMIVTHGRHGAHGWEDGNYLHLPAFQHQTIDHMGAGDAFFSITAPMSKTGSLEDLLLIGNAAGALKCSIVGHREPVTKEHLIEFLKTHAAG